MSSEAVESGATAAEHSTAAALPGTAAIVRIGDRAVATSPLCPGGIVTIHGRRHSARLADTGGPMAMPGAELVVVAGDNAGFLVRLTASVVLIDLPRRGEAVHGSFGAAIQSDARRDERRRDVFERVRARRLRVRGFAAGASAGFLAAFLCWLWPSVSWPSEFRESLSLVLGAPLAFGLAAVWLAGQLDARFAETDSNLRGLSLPTTFLMLAGAAAGGSWAIPRWGLLSGVGVAVITALFLGSPLPAIVLFAAAGAEDTSLEGPGGGTDVGQGTGAQ